MRAICEDIKSHVPEVVREWERRVREEPWFSLPAEHRIDQLPAVIVGLVESSLCEPVDTDAHRENVIAASEHGLHRRQQGVPEHLILTEYHLLRQAIWYYLVGRFGASDQVADAIMRIDTAITLATNASMWGYHREEVEAMQQWDRVIDRIASESPLLVGKSSS